MEYIVEIKDPKGLYTNHDTNDLSLEYFRESIGMHSKAGIIFTSYPKFIHKNLPSSNSKPIEIFTGWIAEDSLAKKQENESVYYYIYLGYHLIEKRYDIFATTDISDANKWINLNYYNEEDKIIRDYLKQEEGIKHKFFLEKGTIKLSLGNVILSFHNLNRLLAQYTIKEEKITEITVEEREDEYLGYITEEKTSEIIVKTVIPQTIELKANIAIDPIYENSFGELSCKLILDDKTSIRKKIEDIAKVSVSGELPLNQKVSDGVVGYQFYDIDNQLIRNNNYTIPFADPNLNTNIWMIYKSDTYKEKKEVVIPEKFFEYFFPNETASSWTSYYQEKGFRKQTENTAILIQASKGVYWKLKGTYYITTESNFVEVMKQSYYRDILNESKFETTYSRIQIAVTGVFNDKLEVFLGHKEFNFTDLNSGVYEFLYKGDIQSKLLTGYKFYVKVPSSLDYEFFKKINFLDVDNYETIDDNGNFKFHLTKYETNGIYLTQNIGYFYDEKLKDEYAYITQFSDIIEITGMNYVISDVNKYSVFYSLIGNGNIMNGLYIKSKNISNFNNEVKKILNYDNKLIAISEYDTRVIASSIQGSDLLFQEISKFHYGIRTKDAASEILGGFVMLTDTGLIMSNGYETQTISSIDDKLNNNNPLLIYNKYKQELLVFNDKEELNYFCYDLKEKKWYEVKFDVNKLQGYFYTKDNDIGYYDINVMSPSPSEIEMLFFLEIKSNYRDYGPKKVLTVLNNIESITRKIFKVSIKSNAWMYDSKEYILTIKTNANDVFVPEEPLLPLPDVVYTSINNIEDYTLKIMKLVIQSNYREYGTDVPSLTIITNANDVFIPIPDVPIGNASLTTYNNIESLTDKIMKLRIYSSYPIFNINDVSLTINTNHPG